MLKQDKIDKIYDTVIAIEKKVAIYEVVINQQRKEIDELNVITRGLVADRNKVTGITWLGAALVTLAGLIISWISNHK